MTLDEAFGIEAVAEGVIRLRVSTATARDGARFFRDLSEAALSPESAVKPVVDHLMPPRREWARPRLEQRRQKSAEDLNAWGLRRVVLGRIKAGTLGQTTWGKALMAFMGEVRAVALSGDARALEEPDVMLTPKEKDGQSYRVLACHRNLVDRMVVMQSARYLRAAVDPLLSSCSYAFRRGGSSHHVAVKKLLQMRQQHAGHDLFVGECDIRKFFDTIHHDVARAAFESARSRLASMGAPVDDRMQSIIDRYLGCYTFPGTAMVKGAELIKTRKLAGRVEWIDEATLAGVYGDTARERIGIPQGGAISTVLANLVLDAADRKVMEGAETGLLYMRFCDDMLVVHQDRTACEAALGRYMAAAKQLRLFLHEPTGFLPGKEAFDQKSKLPYAWGDGQGRSEVARWVSFLGYQVRHDGVIRVRRESILRQKARVREFARKISALAGSPRCGWRVDPGRVAERVEARMISMSVGRVSRRLKDGRLPAKCWADGFRLLQEFEHDVRGLRSLDQVRERNLRRLRRKILAKGANQIPDGLVEAKDVRTVPEEEAARPYHGAPYSYFGAFGDATFRCAGSTRGYGE